MWTRVISEIDLTEQFSRKRESNIVSATVCKGDVLKVTLPVEFEVSAEWSIVTRGAVDFVKSHYVMEGYTPLGSLPVSQTLEFACREFGYGCTRIELVSARESVHRTLLLDVEIVDAAIHTIPPRVVELTT